VRTSRIYQGWKRVAITLEIMEHLRVESSGNYRERGVVDHEGNLLNDCLMKAGEVVNSGRDAHNYSPWVLLYDGVLRNSPQPPKLCPMSTNIGREPVRRAFRARVMEGNEDREGRRVARSESDHVLGLAQALDGVSILE
jgi:hypothetical protein